MKRTSKALAVLAIVATPVVLAPAGLASAQGEQVVATPACGSPHPALPGGAFVWAALPGDGFAGGTGYLMEITNEGRRACSLRGVPGAAVQGSNGHLIGRELAASGKGELVILKPGATAHFSLIVHDAGIVCAHPVSGEIEITLPGQRQAQDGWQDVRACAGLRGGGVLSPGPIQPGIGVPLYGT